MSSRLQLSSASSSRLTRATVHAQYLASCDCHTWADQHASARKEQAVVDQISTPVMLVVRMKGVLHQSKDTNNKTRGKESSSNADARAGDCVSSALALASAPPQMGPFSCAKTHTIPEESPVPPLLYCSHHRSGGRGCQFSENDPLPNAIRVS